jgi:hypothetical protein
MYKTIGYILLGISCLSFLLIPVAPIMGLTTAQIAGITTGLIITGEITFYLSIFILGKSFYEKLKSKFKFRKVRTDDPDLPS